MYDVSKSTWLNPNIEYLFNVELYEYDEIDGGFNIIKEFKLLPDSKIIELGKLDKYERMINIGKIQRDDKLFSQRLTDGFMESRRLFIDKNKLSDNRIISVKKDALFITDICQFTKFGNIEFKQKNSYTSYIRFANNSNIELYYNENDIHVKGIGDTGVNRHRLYMLNFLSTIIGYIESKNSYVKRYIRNFINDYRLKKLDDAYYIKFNNRSDEEDLFFNYINILVPLVQIIQEEL